MSVVETGSQGGDEGFQEFCIGEFLEGSEGCATDIFVRVLLRAVLAILA